jgi:hypothetical protein
MAAKDVSFNVRILLYPIAFLLFYQFAGSTLGLFISNFNVLIAFCSIFSILVSFFLFRKSEINICISSRQLILALLFVAIATFLFVLRINWGIFDFICPTGILGITHQISEGKFPATYPSFPEVTMNYHQGFLFIVGTFSYLLEEPPALVLKIAFIISFILIAISLIGLFLIHLEKYYMWPLVLFIFISSVSPKYVVDLSLYNFVNVFEYIISNSWPLALLGIILILFMSSMNSRQSFLHPVILLIILTLSTVNATVFSLLVMTMGILIARGALQIKSKKYLIKSSIYLLCLGIMYVIPKYLPSAFLIGENYEIVQAKFKWAEIGSVKYLKSTAQYFLLSNPITFIGLFICVKNLKAKVNQNEIFLSFFLIVTFCFPLIIYIPNIAAWDNIHKFAILNIFLSILLIGYKIKADNKNQKLILAGTFFSLVCSIPADIDLFQNRSSMHFYHLIGPNDFSKDIVTYLIQEKEKKKLFGFRHDAEQKCSEDGFSSIAQYAGIPYANGYFPEVFLLSSKLEKKYLMTNEWWKSNNSFASQIISLKPGEFILMKNNDRVEFVAKLNSAMIEFHPKQLIEFKNFSLFKSKE